MKAEQRVYKNLARRFSKLLPRAGLPMHYTPYSLRHSFVSILISKGYPIAYVKDALGHASIQMTVDTYGSCFQSKRRAPSMCSGVRCERYR